MFIAPIKTNNINIKYFANYKEECLNHNYKNKGLNKRNLSLSDNKYKKIKYYEKNNKSFKVSPIFK